LLSRRELEGRGLKTEGVGEEFWRRSLKYKIYKKSGQL
jgi:hypothetical protein